MLVGIIEYVSFSIAILILSITVNPVSVASKGIYVSCTIIILNKI